MDDRAEDAARPRRWKDRLLSPRGLATVAAGLAAGAAASGIGWRLWLAPRKEIARRRFETMRDVTTLYGLQVAYRKTHPSFANELDALLALSPDGAAIKARMPDHLDAATLTVVGDSTTFKVEANVLDDERTLVKIKGPIEDKPTERPPVPVLPAAPAVDAGGKPLNSR